MSAAQSRSHARQQRADWTACRWVERGAILPWVTTVGVIDRLTRLLHILGGPGRPRLFGGAVA